MPRLMNRLNLNLTKTFKLWNLLVAIVLLLVMLMPMATPALAADTGWSRRSQVLITENSGSLLTDYQVKVVVAYDSDMKADFSDVRFVDNNDIDQLPYWLESKIDGSTATFWVKVPSIPASGIQTIWMYYGNPGVSTTSDIHNTFIWGDDFGNATWTSEHINMSNLEGGDSYQEVLNGEYHMTGSYIGHGNQASLSEPIAEIGPGGQGNGDNNTLTQFPANYVVEANVETLTDNSGGNKTGAAFICPRYRNVSWKYETVLDLQNQQAILNKVVNDGWTNLDVRYLGYQVEAGTWYKLKAVVLLDGSHNNLQVFVNGEKYIDGNDSSLLYPSYDGLAFIGYDWDEAFHVVYDNFRVRQYASQEPTTWIGAEERVTGVIPSWWDSSWSRRASVTITETSGSLLTDYQVKVEVPYDSDMLPDFGDVRFVGQDANELHYWLQSYTAGNATFWVKFPSIPALGNTTIQMYYGNPSVSTTSDIHNTFIWGDDFGNATWTGINLHILNSGNSTQYVDSGQYHMQGNSGDLPIAEVYEIGSLKQFPTNYIAEADINPVIKTGDVYIAPRYHTIYGMYEDALNMQYSYAALNKVVSGVWTPLGSPFYLPYPIEAGAWYKLKAVTLQEGSTNRLQFFVNDEQYINQTDPDLSYNGLAFLAYNYNDPFHVAYDNFRVRQYASQEPVTTLGLEEQAEPTVTTEAASDITTNSATLNGNITATGGEGASNYAFVWDSSSHAAPSGTPPGTYANSWTSVAGSYGLGGYDSGSNVTGLSSGTLYYFRFGAHNTAGWSWGEEGNFTTGVTAPDWDVNSDGCINILDAILVGQYWGETGGIHWIRQDVNRDGKINILDAILIGQHWGEGCGTG